MTVYGEVVSLAPVKHRPVFPGRRPDRSDVRPGDIARAPTGEYAIFKDDVHSSGWWKVISERKARRIMRRRGEELPS